MSMHDEVRKEQIKWKEMTFKKKLQYFWDYYKIHTFVVLLIIIVAGIFIKDAINAKDTAFSATILNAYGSEVQDTVQADFAGYAGIDLTNYDCSIDTTSTLSYETMSPMDLAVSQRIVAMAQTNGLDILVGNEEPFTNYAQGLMFKDLREVLSDEEYSRYEPYFFYIDKAVIDKQDENNDVNYDEEGNIAVVDMSMDHKNPSAMEEPIPVGIYLTDSAKLKEWKLYDYDDVSPVFGFVYSSEKPELCLTFLKYLTENT